MQQRLKTLNVNTILADMIPNTYALGYDTVEEFISDVHTCNSDSIDFDHHHASMLLIGAVIVSEIRAAVYEETGIFFMLAWRNNNLFICHRLMVRVI